MSIFLCNPLLLVMIAYVCVHYTKGGLTYLCYHFQVCAIWDRLEEEEVCQLLKVSWEWSQTGLYGEILVIGSTRLTSGHIIIQDSKKIQSILYKARPQELLLNCGWVMKGIL